MTKLSRPKATKPERTSSVDRVILGVDAFRRGRAVTIREKGRVSLIRAAETITDVFTRGDAYGIASGATPGLDACTGTDPEGSLVHA